MPPRNNNLIKNDMEDVELHPLRPFLPGNAQLLMLGSFPPQRKRWSMDFYYPNWNNDMWRITGLVFFNDKEHFVLPGQKAFCKEKLIGFLQDTGIALYDTATAIRRLQDNASDKFLEIVQPTDVASLLAQLPPLQGHSHHRGKSHRNHLHATAHSPPRSRRPHGVSFSRPPATPLPHAILIACLSPLP